MGKTDPRVDAYIAKSADFARPVLRHLRQVIHDACPQVEETIKWSCPHFMYHGILGAMAAFKKHCVFGVWHSSVSMGNVGRITGLEDLPKDAVISREVKKLMKRNASGVKAPRPTKPKAKKPIKPPAAFLTVLKKNKKALATFENLSPSRKREYVEWIVEAKRDETRAKRLATAVAWLAEGKTRNWKYERKKA